MGGTWTPGSSESPYRTPVIKLPAEERKLEVDVGVIVVTVESPRVTAKFTIEGSGPEEGVWHPLSRGDYIDNHIIYADELLMDLLEKTHKIGFMFIPETTYIIPESQILHINAERRNKILTYDVHKWYDRE